MYVVSPLSITKDNASAIQVVLDQRLVDSTAKIAVHPSKSDVTVFVAGSEIKSYLENAGAKVTVVEFTLISVQAASKAEVKKARPPTKTVPVDSKVEGAELIGCTVKKEVDFSNWYQQVLTKGDMLDYYDISGCYILKVGCFSCLLSLGLTGQVAVVLFHLGKSPALVRR